MELSAGWPQRGSRPLDHKRQACCPCGRHRGYRIDPDNAEGTLVGGKCTCVKCVAFTRPPDVQAVLGIKDLPDNKPFARMPSQSICIFACCCSHKFHCDNPGRC